MFLALLAAFGSFFNKLVIYWWVNVSTRASVTGLTCVEKDSIAGLIEIFLDVGIFSHDQGRLSTELEGDSFEVFLMTVSHNVITDFSRPREGNFVYSWMSHQICSSVSFPWDDVDHSIGKPSLFYELSDLQSWKRSLLCALHHHFTASCQGRG